MRCIDERVGSSSTAARLVRLVTAVATVVAIGACGPGGTPNLGTASGTPGDVTSGNARPLPRPLTPVCPTWDEKSAVLPPLVSPDSPTAAVAGTIPGAFEVTSSGAAKYSMAIELPRGRQGMDPEIGLTYDSASGYGLLGLGFSLSGLSEIS